MAYISSVSFLVLINGVASPFFTSKMGFRQGFPLSPLIFLLVADGLRRAIGFVVGTGNIQGILITLGLIITHFLFVNDVIILCNGWSRDAKKLSGILNLFRSATGMIINPQKSTLTFNGFEEEVFEAY